MKTEEQLIKEYNCLPVNSPKFDKKIKKYKIVYSVEKKNGENYLYLTLIKQKQGVYYDKIKKICLEKF